MRMRLVQEGYFPMQNVKPIDNQCVIESVVEKWYAELVNKLLPNCINLHVQKHR